VLTQSERNVGARNGRRSFENSEKESERKKVNVKYQKFLDKLAAEHKITFWTREQSDAFHSEHSPDYKPELGQSVSVPRERAIYVDPGSPGVEDEDIFLATTLHEMGHIVCGHKGPHMSELLLGMTEEFTVKNEGEAWEWALANWPGEVPESVYEHAIDMHSTYTDNWKNNGSRLRPILDRREFVVALKVKFEEIKKDLSVMDRLLGKMMIASFEKSLLAGPEKSLTKK